MAKIGAGKIGAGLMWIFGDGLAAECVRSAINPEDFQGFCVDAPALDEVSGILPVSFEKVFQVEPDPVVFVAIGYRSLNHKRAEVISRLVERGARLTSVVTTHEETVKVGANCFVMRDSVIHPYVNLGDDVFIWGGATVCHHVSIGNHVWVTAGATIAGNTVIGNNVFIGANATVASGVTVGSNVFIGAGSLVTADIPDDVAIASPPSPRVGVTATEFVAFLESRGSF